MLVAYDKLRYLRAFIGTVC